MTLHPRRQFITTSTRLVAGAAVGGLVLSNLLGQTPTPPTAAPKPPPRPPALPSEKVQAVVAQAHRSLDAVKSLVDETPLLVNACWDWGGGDFETPLEAAAHTGQREIAEYLLAHGARPSLFAAAMLGELGLVQAFHAVDPRAHAIAGPHGFTVVHCARRGGERAQPVVDWLLANGASAENHVGLRYVWPPGTEPKSSS